MTTDATQLSDAACLRIIASSVAEGGMPDTADQLRAIAERLESFARSSEAVASDVDTVRLLLDGFTDDTPIKEVRAMLERQFGSSAALAGERTVYDIIFKHRRHVEQSPGAGADAQSYALAVIDDIEADLRRSLSAPSASAGTPEARLRWIGQLAQTYCGHSPFSSEPPEVAIERALLAARAADRAGFDPDDEGRIKV
ncbi:MAG TPA: hypothetical protein VFU31_24755 [Candidatus Binatia bacterium]|nr:hypothetical protein [Candidatus Binatia bacterium]